MLCRDTLLERLLQFVELHFEASTLMMGIINVGAI